MKSRIEYKQVASVDAKAKVWPDEQYRKCCGCERRWWVLENAKPSERGGGMVYYYIDHDPDQVMHARERKAA